MSTEPAPLRQRTTSAVDGPHVVAIGGGHGLSNALRAATSYAGRVDAVVSVTDDGGSSGRLVPHLDIPPPGDIRKCLLALAPSESPWTKLFDYRFDESDVAGHSLGNLILAALADIEGSFENALVMAERLLRTSGSVIPACRDHLKLVAESDDSRLDGQVTIGKHRGRIDSVWVEPLSAAATPHAVDVIESADQILLGPGSLITSTVAAMRVPGITEAINRSGARVDYIANLITQDGETYEMDGIDHLDALLRLTGVRPPAAIVANEHEFKVPPPHRAIEFDPDLTATYGADLVSADLVDTSSTWPSHDPVKLGLVLSSMARTGG